MPKQFQHIVSVEGKGAFPIDMLRYDGVTPRHESDSSKIGAYGAIDADSAVVVELFCLAEKGWLPTYERWKSFRWKVVGHEIKN